MQQVEGTTKTKRRRSNKRRGNMVENIKSIALNLFNQWGYRGTTVRDICNEIGITAPSLYYYFDSKETIFTTLLDDALTLLRESIASAMINCKENSAPEKMKVLFETVLQFNRDYPDHALFIVKNRCFEEKGLDEVIDAKLKPLGKDMLKVTTTFLKTSQKRRMPKSHVKDVITAFDGFVTGYLLQLHQGLIEDTSEQAQKSWELFWEGIK